MNADTKKYLTYGGVALLIGSLGYFIYSTVRNKPLVLDNTQLLIGENEDLDKPIEDNFASTETNPFSNLKPIPEFLGYKIPTKFNLFN